MAKIIDGKLISSLEREKIAKEVAQLSEKGVTPGLAVLIVGEDPASQVYVRNKHKACESVGIYSEVIELPENMSRRVTRIDFMPGRALIPRSNCSVVSYGGNTYINFTRTILEADIEKRFLTSLVKMGIPVFVEGNERY